MKYIRYKPWVLVLVVLALITGCSSNKKVLPKGEGISFGGVAIANVGLLANNGQSQTVNGTEFKCKNSTGCSAVLVYQISRVQLLIFLRPDEFEIVPGVWIRGDEKGNFTVMWDNNMVQPPLIYKTTIIDQAK
jgi:hypothetical protein